ncbi:hypothetical protein R5R35_000958 [Gryllus longicercus]|uniref:Cytochrome P450 n=1 Tax=Gryllus longicercus TaxID=2509291 RepID=A0AAN9Z2F9_9ORTH
MAPLSSKVEHSLLEVGDDAESLPRASAAQPPPPSAKPHPHPHPPEPLASASGTEAGPRPVPAVEVGAGEGAGRHDGLRGARLLMLRVLLLTAIALYLLRRVLPLLLLLTAAAAAWSLRRAGYWRRRGVPGPAPAPLVGNLWPLLRLRVGPGDFVGDIYRSAPDSPYVGFFILDKPCLVLRDPALIKRVLVRDFHAFAARHAAACPAVDPAGATNLFIARGRCWQLTRRALSPCFTAARLRALFPAMQRRTAALADFIQASSAAPGRPLKAKDAVARGVTDLVGECLFGVEAHALRLGDAAAMRAHGRRIFGFSPRRALEILSVFFVPALVRPLGVEFFHRGSSAYLERVFKELLRARRQGDGEGEGPRRGDALDDLLALPGRVRAALAKDGDDARGDDATRAATSDEHLVGQAMVFFTAGFETTASTISVALFELARSPRAQGRLRAELAAARARHGGLSYDALNDAPYLNMVISEALRLYPSLPYVDRTCSEAYPLAEGLTLEAGTPVFVPVMALHRDERLYPRAHAFVPERWAAAADAAPPLYMPFGAGPRTCIGMRFALLAIKLTLAQLLLRFEVQPCAQTPTRLKVSPFGLFLKFYGGIPLQFRSLSTEGSSVTDAPRQAA